MNDHVFNDRGAVLVLFAVSLTLFLLSLALVVDIGWILITRHQLHNAADAAALAGAAALMDEDLLEGTADQSDDLMAMRNQATFYAGLNQAAHQSVNLALNETNAPDGGVTAGFIDNPLDVQSPFLTENPPLYNSVQVRAERSGDINGMLRLFLGGVTGVDSVAVQAQSTATLENRIAGFAISAPDQTLEMLPFAVSRDAWHVATNGSQPLPPFVECADEMDVDDFAFVDGGVQISSDGIPEVKMFPHKEGICGQGVLPGNFGTIDIGPSNNSTDDLRRQIREGISQTDLAVIGGFVLTDEDGDGVANKWLQGETGVSNGISQDVQNIIGKTRVLPLYRQAFGQGDSAQFEIVGFAGVRVMNVQLTGALQNRHIVVQSAQMMVTEAVVDPQMEASDYIFTLSLTR